MCAARAGPATRPETRSAAPSRPASLENLAMRRACRHAKVTFSFTVVMRQEVLRSIRCGSFVGTVPRPGKSVKAAPKVAAAHRPRGGVIAWKTTPARVQTAESICASAFRDTRSRFAARTTVGALASRRRTAPAKPVAPSTCRKAFVGADEVAPGEPRAVQRARCRSPARRCRLTGGIARMVGIAGRQVAAHPFPSIGARG